MNTERQRIDSQNVIIFANCERHLGGFYSSLARVGTLPVLLRTILTLHGIRVGRIIVCIPAAAAQDFKSALRQCGRLPSSVEYREVGPDIDLWSFVTEVAAMSASVMLVLGNRIYQPRLLQSAAKWRGTGTLAVATRGELAGILVVSQSAALNLGSQSTPVEIREVDVNSWHNIVTPADLPVAERKLDTWLGKLTDGLFAHMNRKISVPISRQLSKLPMTPNMLTMVALGVSFASGLSFARGGYWSTLFGAALSLAASILNDCNGKVERLKLQSTRFGGWLETVCEYLNYLFVFGGIFLGLTRSSGTKNYLAWGGLLCFGAIMTFLVVSFTRQRLSGAGPTGKVPFRLAKESRG